jgi:hypothetical protein
MFRNDKQGEPVTQPQLETITISKELYDLLMQEVQRACTNPNAQGLAYLSEVRTRVDAAVRGVDYRTVRRGQ